MKSKIRNRLLAMALTAALAAGLFPVSALAAEQDCTHEHDPAICGYIAEVEGQPCAFAHEHDDTCGWEADASPCSVEADHVHDPSVCGYVEAVAGTPCNHIIHDEDCGGLTADSGSTPGAQGELPTTGGDDVPEDAGTITVTAFDELDSGVRVQSLPLGAPESDVTLPATLGASGFAAGGTEPERFTIEGVTWQPTGEQDSPAEYEDGRETPCIYYYRAVLPEGYALDGNAALPEIEVRYGMASRGRTGGAGVTVGDFVVSGSNLEQGDTTTHKDFYLDNNVLHITTNKPMTIAMKQDAASTAAYRLAVMDSVTANVTVNGVKIDRSSTGGTAWDVNNGCTLNLTLAKGSENSFIGGKNDAGMQVQTGTTIVIGGSGKLTAAGGVYGGAGIGGGVRGDGGSITVTGSAVVTATGGVGAGIGGGSGGAGGTIIISGSSNVTATGGYFQGGGGAGIGGGGNNGGDGGIITISGDAHVIATGKDGGAGIGGGGFDSGSGTITISDSANVTANGSRWGAGIGGAGGTIAISDRATVTATGGENAAGIGGHYRHGGGKITISGSVNVTATGGDIAAGIGGGFGGSGGEIAISGNATVNATGKGGGAGIGGGGGGENGSGISGGGGGTVKISGTGTEVTATGGNQGYDVGHGMGLADNTHGTGGSLSVTDGAELIYKNNGTNITSREYKDCTITDKNGNSTKYGSSGQTLAITTLTLAVTPQASQTYPGDVTLTATLTGAASGSSGKTIVFTVSGTSYNATTDASGVATYMLNSPSAGSYNFGASFAGDDANAASTAAGISDYTVHAAAQQALTLIGLDSDYTYGVQPFKLSTSGGSGTGAVSYTSSAPSIASVAGDTVTIHKAGTFTITATKAADANYSAVSATSGVITVGKRPLDGAAITLAAGPYVYTGGAVTPAVTKVEVAGITVPDAAVEVTYKNNTSVGTATVTITAKADSSFSGSTSANFTIQSPGSTPPDNKPSDNNHSSSGGSSSSGSPAITVPKTSYTAAGDSISQSVSRSDLKRLADSGKSLTLRSGKAGMSFDPAALQAILAAVPSTARNITFAAAPAGLSAFPDAARPIGSRPAYDFAISYKDSKGKTARANVTFPAGSAAITLSYTPAPTEVTGSLFLVYVDGKGAVTWLDKSSYNGGKVLAEVPHFSAYGVAYKAPAPVFTDVAGHPAEADMRWAAARGLFPSTGETIFGPESAVTRGAFSAALDKLTVSASGRLANPDDPLTREQMAVLLAERAKQAGYSIPAPLAAAAFADNGKISEWAAKEVAAMQRAGIARGKDGNRFDPQAGATRAQASAVLRRFVEVMIDPATATGFVRNDSGKWLYYRSGKALTGWQSIGGKWYYFYPDGAMAVNTKIDGYEIGPNGARKEEEE